MNEEESTGKSSIIGKLSSFFIRKPMIAIPMISITLPIVSILLIVFLLITFFAADEQNGIHQSDNADCQAEEITITGEIKEKNIVLNASTESGLDIKDIKGTVTGNNFTAEKKSEEDTNNKGVIDTTTCPGIIWQTFRQSGYSEETTAGVMGNLQAESSYNPSLVEVGGGPGRGLMQWSYGSERWDALVKYAKKKGTKWNDCRTQAEFLTKEIKTETRFIDLLKKRENSTIKDYLALKDVPKSCEWTCRYYVRPKGYLDQPYPGAQHPTLHWSRRLNAAKKAYKDFTGKAFGENAELNGTIEKDVITISGTINGQPVDATGDIKNGRFTATGLYGNTAGCNDDNGLNASVCGFSYPTGKKKFDITSPSCEMRWHRFHHGVDFGTPSGTPLYSILDGIVMNFGYEGSRGKVVYINHGDALNKGKDLWTVSQHMSSFSSSLKVGGKVEAGQNIGKSGNTGKGTGPHLHFEMHLLPKGAKKVVWKNTTQGSEICNPKAEKLLDQLAKSSKKDCDTNTGNSNISGIASYAKQFKGYKYGNNRTPWDGTKENFPSTGVDCSGFIQGLYAHYNVRIPRTSAEICASKKFVKVKGSGTDNSGLKPGDVFCYPGHVALYIGNDQLIHASTPTKGIIISPTNYNPKRPRSKVIRLK